MKISLNIVRQLCVEYSSSEDATAIGADLLAEKVGAQLGGIDEIIKISDKYKDVTIVKIVKCEDHPGADRLHVCAIDDGGKTPDIKRDEQGFIQVVCGAPNVRAGMIAAWLPPGATVPNTIDKEPFVLDARELRGVMSYGMLASPKELDLGDSHEGLLVIDEGNTPGSNFGEVYRLKDDTILDIENKMFTHRPDCFGFLGVTREMSGIQGLAYKSPGWYQTNAKFIDASGPELPIVIKNEIPALVPRFAVLTMSGVKVATSPTWLQVELSKAGIRPINNLVDMGNFYMLLTGQPLHVYDYDKVKAHDSGADHATLVIRNPKNEEDLTLLNGKTIKPRDEAIMIATESKVIGLAGVMGGQDTEVSADTTNIIIECATFDMYSIRKSSMEHGIFSDAVTRFNKGQSPLQNLAVLAKVVESIKFVAGGEVASSVIDDNNLSEEVMNRESLHAPVTLNADYVNVRLGTTLGIEDMQKLLQNVEFEATASEGNLTVKAPFWRTDIELKEDVVEEIGRLYGFDHLPLELPKRDLTPAVQEPLLTLKQKVRNNLSSCGANEVLTYSFVHGNLLEKVGQNQDDAFGLSNALSPDLQYYRLSLLPSLLDKVHANIKAGYNEFALFEMGKTHSIQDIDEAGLPTEQEVLSFVYTAHEKLKKTEPAYYEAKFYLESLAKKLGIDLEFNLVSDKSSPLTGAFAEGRVAAVFIKGQHESIGMIGEFSANVRRKLKLSENTAGFEINLCKLLASQSESSEYVALPKFPKVTQDVTLKATSNTVFNDINLALIEALTNNETENSLGALSPVDIYQSKDSAEQKSITWRYEIASYDRTLTDTEVNKIIENAILSLESLGASRA